MLHQTTETDLRFNQTCRTIKSVTLVHWFIMAEFLEAVLLLPKLKLEETSNEIANHLIMSLETSATVTFAHSHPQKIGNNHHQNVYFFNTWWPRLKANPPPAAQEGRWRLKASVVEKSQW